jgi:hypothetical protein
MAPPFAPTHSWVCPIWRWSHGQLTSPGGTIFDSAHTTHWAMTTVLYVANSWSTPFSVHAECYLADGMQETGVSCSGTVNGRRLFKASLNPTRAPVVDARGDFNESGEGWFQLWSNGPVTPAAMTLVIFAIPGWSPMELVVPVEPVEMEPAVADVTPVHVEVPAAPEGVGGAAEGDLETHLSLPEAMAWFEGHRAGRPLHHRDN